MLKGINWKYYLIFAGIATLASALISWKIAVGFLLGTGCYFLNLLLAEKKFPNLNLKTAAIGGALAVIALEGLLTVLMALGTWFIGKLPCFIAGFAAMIVPNIYFFILSLKK